MYTRRSVKSKTTSPSAKLQARTALAKAMRSVASSSSRMMTSRSLGSRVFGKTSLSEVKYFDMQLGNVSNALVIWSTPAQFSEPAAAFTGFTCINEVQQGAAAYNRVGNKIVIKSIAADFDITAPAASQNPVRTVLVYDRQTNGAAPALADVFYSDPAGATSFTSSINMRNKSRFQIIRDQYHLLNDGSGLIYHVKLYAKGRWEVEYKANAGTIGDIATGAIFLFVFYGTLGAAGVATMRDLSTRIRFFD